MKTKEKSNDPKYSTHQNCQATIWNQKKCSSASPSFHNRNSWSVNFKSQVSSFEDVSEKGTQTVIRNMGLVLCFWFFQRLLSFSFCLFSLAFLCLVFLGKISESNIHSSARDIEIAQNKVHISWIRDQAMKETRERSQEMWATLRCAKDLDKSVNLKERYPSSSKRADVSSIILSVGEDDVFDCGCPQSSQLHMLRFSVCELLLFSFLSCVS